MIVTLDDFFLYEPPAKSLWKGRNAIREPGNQYWHQEIKLNNLLNTGNEIANSVCILGYACDEGVGRNYGRYGAKFGADMLRKALAKLPVHFENQAIYDLGNISCPDKDLERTQYTYSKIITWLINNRNFTIGFGGGHDMSFAHYDGLRNALKNSESNKIAIVNLDAHFDLRKPVSGANSGTPFRQIIEHCQLENKNVDYIVLGIQQQANTRELFDYADEMKIPYVLNYDCEMNNFQGIKTVLQPIIERNDFIYLTIDMDGFSSAYAPGVSAPSPLGFTPFFALKVLNYILVSGKLIACDIAEINPDYDKDDATVRLGARLIDNIVWQISNQSYACYHTKTKAG